jgi:8-oxo-dGTP pyrophosphatase MutT (NUDIX family)
VSASPLRHLDAAALGGLLRERFRGTRPSAGADDRFLGLTARESRRFRHLFPATLRPAAVLVPIVARPAGPTFLFTERASAMRHHGGQTAFPGGAVEPGDADAVAAALRETEEEIGMPRAFVEVFGFLPDHVVFSGYRVTPVVAEVRPGFPLALDRSEVAAVFEVPLGYALDPDNRRALPSTVAGWDATLHEIRYGPHRIWGATAGMLITLERFLLQGPDPVEDDADG